FWRRTTLHICGNNRIENTVVLQALQERPATISQTPPISAQRLKKA
mgnify:CR=1